MMEENNEESYTETQELNEIAGLALRFNKRGAFEQMVANHLVLSVNSEHLHKVTLVCEAVYMSDIDKLKIDKETVNKIYAVALFSWNKLQERLYLYRLELSGIRTKLQYLR